MNPDNPVNPVDPPEVVSHASVRTYWTKVSNRIKSMDRSQQDKLTTASQKIFRKDYLSKQIKDQAIVMPLFDDNTVVNLDELDKQTHVMPVSTDKNENYEMVVLIGNELIQDLEDK